MSNRPIQEHINFLSDRIEDETVLVIRDQDSSEVVISSVQDFRTANRGQLSRTELRNLLRLLAGRIPEMPCGMGFIISKAKRGEIEPYAAKETDVESRYANQDMNL